MEDNEIYNNLLKGQVEKNVNLHNLEPFHDEAPVVDIATPILSSYLGGKVFNFTKGLSPFLGDLWAGRKLLFSKPYRFMNNEDKQILKRDKTEFYRNFLNKNPIDTPFGTVNFRVRQNGEIDTKYARQLPLARFNLSKFNKKDSIPLLDHKERPNIEYFDNFKTKWLGKDYDYQIRHNKNDKSMDFYNIKDYKLFEDNLNDPKYKRYIED